MKNSLAEMLDEKIGSFYSSQADAERRIEGMMEKATRNITIYSPSFGYFYSPVIGGIVHDKLKNKRTITVLTNERVAGDKDASVEKLAEDSFGFFRAILNFSENGLYFLPEIAENLNFYFMKKPGETDSEIIVVDQSIALATNREGKYKCWCREDGNTLREKYLKQINRIICKGGAYVVDTTELLNKTKELSERKEKILV